MDKYAKAILAVIAMLLTSGCNSSMPIIAETAEERELKAARKTMLETAQDQYLCAIAMRRRPDNVWNSYSNSVADWDSANEILKERNVNCRKVTKSVDITVTKQK